MIAEATATRTGARKVVIHHAAGAATFTDDGSFWTRFGEGDGIPMASLYDAERRDTFTTSNFAKSIAGYFDGRFSVSS